MKKKVYPRHDPPSVDDVVNMAIQDLYPQYIIPDEDNYTFDKKAQYKAPDYEILQGRILLELKSVTPSDTGRFFGKLQCIAQEQGVGLIGYGRGRVDTSHFPLPRQAERKFTDYLQNQSLKSALASQKKFEEYAKHRSIDGRLCVVIISHCDEMPRETASSEYFYGRKMGGIPGQPDLLQVIDSIILIYNPRFVFDQINSYWFKCLIRSRLSILDRAAVQEFAAQLHRRVAAYAPYYAAAESFKRSGFSPTIV